MDDSDIISEVSDMILDMSDMILDIQYRTERASTVSGTLSHSAPHRLCHSYASTSYTRCHNTLQQTMFRIESPLSMNQPLTISIPELSSLAVSWSPHVSLLHNLIILLCFAKVLPLA